MSRIVAGSAGGRRLATPPGDLTRPTTDRVREALFSAIVSWAGRGSEPPDEALAGLAFVDLYAGSGAVGLEAASRGAAPVLLVESHRRAAAVAARNLAETGLAAQLRTVRVERLASEPAPRAYDVVVADPPYELDATALDAVVADLDRYGWVADDGLIVLERSSRGAPPTWPAGFEAWERRYGETVLHFASR